jgi:hypothetical protein
METILDICSKMPNLNHSRGVIVAQSAINPRKEAGIGQ